MNGSGPVLRDIHLPTAAWWPLAPGWWVLAAALALAVTALLWWWRRRTLQPALAAALRALDALAADHARDGNAVQFAEGASRLLRRVALRIEPAAASRSGPAWREFLHRHARDAAVREALDRLLDARFRAVPVLDVAQQIAALRSWCMQALATRAAPPTATPESGRLAS